MVKAGQFHLFFMAVSVFFGTAYLISPVYALIAIFGLSILLLFYIRPKIGYYICLSFAPTTSFMIGYINTTTFNGNFISQIDLYNAIPITHLLVSATFFVLLAKGAFFQPADISKAALNEKMYFLPIVFLTWGIITVFWSMDVSFGIILALKLTMSIFLMMIMQKFIITREDLLKTIKALVIISIVMGSATFISKYEYIFYSKEIFKNINAMFILFQVQAEERPGGFAGTNNAGAMVVFFMFMVIALYPYVKSSLVKAFLVFWWMFLLLDIILMSSKAGMVTLLAGMFFLPLINANLRKKALLWCAATLAALVLVFAFNAEVLKDKRMTSKGSSKLLVGSFTSRFEDWKKGFRMLENTGIGAGLGGTSTIVRPSAEEHSTYFSILFDMGVVGLVIFLSFIMQIGLKLLRAIRENRDVMLTWPLHCISAAFFSLLLQGLLNNFQYTYYFWIVMGLAFSVSKISRLRV